MIATCPFTVLSDSSVASGEDDSEDHILSLSEHPNSFTRISWEDLYVALTRVKFKGDSHLLLKGGDRSTMD